MACSFIFKVLCFMLYILNTKKKNQIEFWWHFLQYSLAVFNTLIVLSRMKISEWNICKSFCCGSEPKLSNSFVSVIWYLNYSKISNCTVSFCFISLLNSELIEPYIYTKTSILNFYFSLCLQAGNFLFQNKTNIVQSFWAGCIVPIFQMKSRHLLIYIGWLYVDIGWQHGWECTCGMCDSSIWPVVWANLFQCCFWLFVSYNSKVSKIPQIQKRIAIVKCSIWLEDLKHITYQKSLSPFIFLFFTCFNLLSIIHFGINHMFEM